MSIWKALKVIVVSGAIIGGTCLVAGPVQTATLTAGAVSGTAFGLGVGTGSLKYAGPGFTAGQQAADKAGNPLGLSTEPSASPTPQ